MVNLIQILTDLIAKSSKRSVTLSHSRIFSHSPYRLLIRTQNDKLKQDKIQQTTHSPHKRRHLHDPHFLIPLPLPLVGESVALLADSNYCWRN